MKFTKEDVAAVLKEARTNSRLSAKTVIEKLQDNGINISVKTLYGYENAHSAPTAKTMFKLCEIYGIQMDAAFGFEKKEKPATEGDGLDERLKLFSSLSPEAQEQALEYMRFLASKEAGK